MKKPLGERSEAVCQWDPCGFRTPTVQLDVTLLYLFLFFSSDLCS